MTWLAVIFIRVLVEDFGQPDQLAVGHGGVAVDPCIELVRRNPHVGGK